MKTLIIPCAGKSKRLTNYYFPKCLLPVNQRPILFQIISFWKEKIDEVIIVLNTSSGKLIKNYIETYFQDKDLDIKYCYQHGAGTYFAIKDAISIAKNKEYILNWSDILLKSPITGVDFSKNFLLTSNLSSCRWEFRNNTFYKHKKNSVSSKDGIIGIFNIASLPIDFLNHPIILDTEVEILEYLNPKDFLEILYEDFLDIGDSYKYSENIRFSENIRAFGSSNHIVITETEVIKNTCNEKLSINEENWYKSTNFSFTPKVINYSPLTLQRIKNSSTVADWLEKNPNKEKETISKIFEILKEIHNYKPVKNSTFEDSYIQYFKKTIYRLDRINFLFQKFNKKLTINGINYKNPKDLLIKNKKNILDIFTPEFRLIHGDLQLSNLLIDDKNNFYVIDPRGYFGNSKLYGDPMYDFAKLYYGFCGMWNKFQKGMSKVRYVNGSFYINPLISGENLDYRRALFFKESKKVNYSEVTKEKIDILHSIIWLSVCDYISNDVLSSLYGYLNGTIYINTLFN